MEKDALRPKLNAKIAAIIVLLAGLGACGKPSGPESEHAFAPGSTMARIAAAGKLTIGITFDQPLLGLRQPDGKFSGFDVEMGKVIATELGINEDKILWRQSFVKNRVTEIARGEVDMVIATYTISEARRKEVSFAGPYLTARQRILVGKGDTSISGPETFRAGDKKVCSVIGSDSSANIRRYLKEPGTQLLEYDIYSKCLDALNANRVDAVTSEDLVLMGYLSQDPNRYAIVGSPFTRQQYGIAVKLKDTAFCNWIVTRIGKAFARGLYRKAWEAPGSAGEMAAVPEGLITSEC